MLYTYIIVIQPNYYVIISTLSYIIQIQFELHLELISIQLLYKQTVIQLFGNSITGPITIINAPYTIVQTKDNSNGSRTDRNTKIQLLYWLTNVI